MITSEKYSSLLDQIKNLSDYNKLMPISKEPVFSVDLNTREIKVPAQFKNLAVYGDHHAETIWFITKRYYDGVDLFLDSKKVAIQFVNALGEEGIAIVDKYMYADSKPFLQDVNIQPDELLIAWNLDYSVTKASGPVSFSLRFFEVDSDSPKTLKYNLSTRTATVTILNGLYITENSSNPVLPTTKIEELVDKITQAYHDASIGVVNYTDILNKPYIDDILIDGPIDSFNFKNVDYLKLKNKPTLNDGIFTGAMTSRNLVIQKNDNNEITDISVGIDVDDALNTESVNPVQNKIVTASIKSAESNIISMQDKISKIEQELAELTFIPMEITAFSVVPNIAEMGSTVSNAKLNWTYNIDKAPKQVLLNDVSIDNTVKEYDVNEDIKETKTFTLKTIDTGKTSEKSTVLNFVNGIYYNAASIPAEYNSDFINSLAQHALSVEKNIELKLEVADGQYAYICTPDANGDYIFTIGGFDGGFGKFPVATVEFTNKFGHTEMYRIYKSDNTNLGSTTVKLS